MQRGRVRVMGVGIAIVAVASMLAVTLGAPARPTGTGSPPPGSTPDAGPPTGPVVYYELVDASASRLVARTLDGRSAPRVVASREDVAVTPSWTLDPSGTIAAVFAGVPGDDSHQDLVAYALVDGHQAWSARIPNAGPGALRWSPDGRSLAIVVDEGAENDQRSLLLLDAATGALRSVRIPSDVWIVGIDAEGAVILEGSADPNSSDRTLIRLLRVDPATLAIAVLPTLPAVGPMSDGDLSIDPSAGVAISTVPVEDQPGVDIRLRDLRTNAVRSIGRAASVDLLSIDPAGSLVAAAENGTVRIIGFDGRAEDVFETDDSISDVAWSGDGKRLLITTYGQPMRLWVVDRETAATIELPLPAIAEARLVAMSGSEPIPAVAVAPSPTPSPTPGPSGADVASMPGLLTFWIDRSGGQLTAHAQQLVPTEGGGVRVTADMAPLDLGSVPVPDDGSTGIRLVPRPGSSDVLVWITTPGGSHGELWDTATNLRRAAPLPKDWPSTASDVAWSPDGSILAASAGISGLDGDFQGVFAIAALGARKTTIVPIVGAYDRLEGWWSATELRVGHGICTEGCSGRYSWSARLRISDHRLRELTPADRGRQVLDLTSTEGRQIVWTMINEDPASDLRIDWPARLGSLDDAEAAIASDARSMIVSRPAGSSTELLRVDDVVGRAVSGRLTDPAPTTIAMIPGRDLQLSFAPGEAWVVARNRVGDTALVRLADGRTWPLDGDRDVTWVRPG